MGGLDLLESSDTFTLSDGSKGNFSNLHSLEKAGLCKLDNLPGILMQF